MQTGGAFKPAFDVIVCGSLHLDIVVQTQALPRLDETAVGRCWKQVCGGKGGNQAVQAARAGARTAMIGRIGQDAFGKALRDNLTAERVDNVAVGFDPIHGSGMSVAILQDNGEYGAVIVSGSNLAIDENAMLETWAALGGGKILIIQNEIPQNVNLAIAQAARAQGAFVVFNAAPARGLIDDLLPFVDLLIVNRFEAEAMSGRTVVDVDSAVVAINALQRQRLSVIITLGGDGLVVASADGGTDVIAPIPVVVTSTHGAGDCFVGMLCAKLANGIALVDACRHANAAAALHVSRSP